ncbi:tape measure protein [Pseudomonas sp. Gutcm_11s]|uniref:tape measure protein n=1 Tax=Pseudomonas sp. Gutcm_11s TaxID=3026088 RepID=UPI002361E662|nr:tape measure protein [Pseudomonas sp. Gutcm_11s]MDD0843366.1 tape measure protein [Pseudomonas sp. Gutcm_11s]
MSRLSERLVQLTLRARDFLSKDIRPASEAFKELTAEGKRLKDSLAEAGRARGLVRTLRDTEGATGSLERAWHDAQATLDDLTREIGDSEQATAGQRIALREARRTADEAKNAYDRSQRAIKNLRAELKALNVDTGSLGSEEDRLTAEIKQNKQAVDDNREAIKQKRIEEKKAADAAQEHASRVDAARGALAAGAKQVLAFAAAFVGLNALLGAVGRGFELLRGGIFSMLQTGDQFEGLQTRMNALMGSLAAGEAATAWVKEFAKNTPLELQDVTDAFAQLQAYGVDPMNGTLQALVDQNEKLGGGMERLGGIIGAVGQAYAKQKLQTEEILQLVERGVPVWDMLSKITGKNAADLQALATKGRLGRDVLAALVKEIGRLSAGAAESNMDRLSGIISTLKDQVTDFYNRIANAGALEYVKGQLSLLSNTISRMAADGSLDTLAKGLSEAFIQGVEKVKQFALSLSEVDFKRLVDDSSAWLVTFGEKIDKTVSAVQLMAAPVRVVANVITGFISGVGTAFTAMVGASLSAMATAAKAIPDLIGGDKIVAGLESARDKVFGLSEALANQVKQDATDLWSTVADAAEAGGERQKKALEDVAASAAESGTDVRSGFKLAETGVLSLNETLLNLVTSGKVGLADLAQAVDVINAASAVQQLESMRAVLLDAFDAGKFSQQEYAQAAGLLACWLVGSRSCRALRLVLPMVSPTWRKNWATCSPCSRPSATPRRMSTSTTSAPPCASCTTMARSPPRSTTRS